MSPSAKVGRRGRDKSRPYSSRSSFSSATVSFRSFSYRLARTAPRRRRVFRERTSPPLRNFSNSLPRSEDRARFVEGLGRDGFIIDMHSYRPTAVCAFTSSRHLAPVTYILPL